MRTILIPFILWSLCILVGCDSMGNQEASGSPEETIKGFIQKVSANDFEGAKAFTSMRTDATMDFMKTRINMLKQMGKEDQIPTLFGGLDLSQELKVTCQINDKKATCECCEEITGNCNNLLVIQEGGKWLIDQPKESSVEQ